MTCIVAMTNGGAVVMGADSCAGDGSFSAPRLDRKVFVTQAGGGLLMGFTSSFRMGDLLRYRLDVARRHPDVPLDRWMRTDFIDAVRACLRAGGYLHASNSVESGGVFMVAAEGRLFVVDSDFQVGEYAGPFFAVGCGDRFALGAFHAAQRLQGAAVTVDDMRARCEIALGAAAAFSGYVLLPFHYEVAITLSASKEAA
jgi:ATP-dependent protease HslVU (ClpYQ) peptidase subunit